MSVLLGLSLKEFPIVLKIGQTDISFHLLFEWLAFFTGFRYFLQLRTKYGDVLETGSRMAILVGAILGSFLGSRIIGGLENMSALKDATSYWLYFYENKTILGGVLGGLLGVEVVKKFIGEKQASGDLFVYPLLLAMIIGRIGCFSMGIYEETYGIPTSLPWALNLGDGIKRHPVVLYEMIFLLNTWLFLKFLDRKIYWQQGARFKVFMIAYCLFRFFLDYVKPRYSLWVGMSAIQMASLSGIIYYYRYFLKPSRLIHK
jgi:prolipoprotein diacylglyceryltransferase